MNIRPLRDHIVAVRIEGKDEKIRGLVIPDTAKEKSMTAKVVAVGTGRVFDSGASVPLEVLSGVNKLASAVRVTLGPKGPSRRHRQEVPLADRH